ncbi:MAG: S8 family peptidase [Bdellovibrionales bacterium]
MKALFVFLVCLTAISISNAYSKEFIVRIPHNSNVANFINQKEFRLSQFQALGFLYFKVSIEDQSTSRFEKLMTSQYPKFVYEENIEYNIFDVDPEFSKQWGLNNEGHNEPISPVKMSPVDGVPGADIGALQAWNYTQGDKKIIVAVIDTGIDYNHSELKNNMWVNLKEKNGSPGVDDDRNGYVDDIYGYDVSNNDSDPMDDNKHGTHVAGVIGAQHDGAGVMGVMANVSLMAIKFTDVNGRGDLERALKGINYAIVNKAKIMSNSWGNRIYSKLLKDAISQANQNGTVFVAAAGNYGANNNDFSPIYPASYKVENVISVGAATADDYPSAFSCFGPNSVHVAAPGTNILSTVPGGSYAVLSGTSQATPFVSGIAGLALSLNPKLTPLELKNLMIDTSIPSKMFTDKNISKGRINAGKLLEKISQNL